MTTRGEIGGTHPAADSAQRTGNGTLDEVIEAAQQSCDEANRHDWLLAWAHLLNAIEKRLECVPDLPRNVVAEAMSPLYAWYGNLPPVPSAPLPGGRRAGSSRTDSGRRPESAGGDSQ